METFNKNEVLQLFIAKMELELLQIEKNLKDIREETTHEENKPENEYDTRAIESGYLVKAQSNRLLDAKEALVAFRHCELKKYNDDTPIQATALIQVEHLGKILWFFYMPFGGGYSIEVKQHKIQVITPSSPLGSSLLKLKVGDVAVVETAQNVKEYEILTVE